LADALAEALKSVDANELKRDISALVPEDVQRILASQGIRDELVFPMPPVLVVQPTLVGYYRLLLGVSQKAFYRSGTGMGRFKSMEIAGRITVSQRDHLPDFCAAMAVSLADLVRQISPPITARDVYELPLLTLGSQLQGANNVTIGRQATLEVFLGFRRYSKRTLLTVQTTGSRS